MDSENSWSKVFEISRIEIPNESKEDYIDFISSNDSIYLLIK